MKNSFLKKPLMKDLIKETNRPCIKIMLTISCIACLIILYICIANLICQNCITLKTVNLLTSISMTEIFITTVTVAAIYDELNLLFLIMYSNTTLGALTLITKLKFAALTIIFAIPYLFILISIIAIFIIKVTKQLKHL